MQSTQRILKTLAQAYAQHWWLPTIMVLLLLPLGASHFLLFHTLVELFAITIAVISTIVAWNTYALVKNQFLWILGCGYFLIAGLDMAHMLTFVGMPFIENNSGNTSLQFASAVKFFEAVLLFSAPLFINERYQKRNFIIALGFLGLVAGWSIFYDLLPVLYVDIEGLTDTKVYFEYFIVFLLAIALVSFWRVRSKIEKSIFVVMNIAITLSLLSALTLSFYSAFDDSMIIVGHILKLLSYWAVYVVLIESSLRQPFLSLAREANTYDAVPDETILVDKFGYVRQINEAVRSAAGYPIEAIGSRCHTLQHDPAIAEENCEICRYISHGKILTNQELYIAHTQQWYEISLSPIRYRNNSFAMVHVRRNVTTVYEAQERSQLYNRLYSVLSYTNKAIAAADSRKMMFDDICAIAIQYGGFKMAWIGLVKDNHIKPQAHAGDKADFLNTLDIVLDDSAVGPVGQAAKNNKVRCVNNTQTEAGFSRWRDAAKKQGYKALAAVPLTLNNQVVGIFSIYSELPDAFDDKMLALLELLGRDISAALKRLKERQKQEFAERKIQQLSQVVEQNSHAILITDTDFKIEYANRAFTVLTGYLLQEIINKTPAILRSQYAENETYREVSRILRTGRRWSGQIRNQRKDGSLYWALQTITPIKNNEGEITHYVSTSEDNTDLHNAQQTIEQLAFYDPLTNLPNRRLLSDRLQQAIEHAQRNPEEMVAVMVFDLDNFKTVNDSLGHNYGDELLKAVAHIFQSQVRREDTVSRQGGDEFTIVLAGMKTSQKVVDIATSILEKLSQPITVCGHQVVIGSSIGIAIFPDDADNPDELLRNADMAMYHAKDEGKNNFQFFTSAMNKQAHQRLLLENKLRNAIEQNHFQLHYQPQIDLRSGELVGLEALIRWIDPEQGMISPAEFIPLAEDTGLIGQIGDWVIETACKEMKTMHDKGLPKIKVAVNVSAFQFSHGKHLTKVIGSALEKYNYPAELFSLELTESILIEDINETLNVLNSMRDLGIILAIDDFGTGYSSLSYLKQFPIDILKIDQSFIRDITTDDSDKAIVSAIIAMAKQLGIEVLAEGVEEVAHQQFLQSQGCDYVQGYLYCKPIPADTLLTRWQTITLASADEY